LKLALLLLFPLAFFSAPDLARAEAGKTVLVAGRVKVHGLGKDRICEICVGCEGFSGGAKRPLLCGEPAFLNGVKYRLRVTPVRVAGRCVLRTEGERKIIAPVDPLPSYPDQKELERTLGCD